jgi:prolyl-tRNA synthetase
MEIGHIFKLGTRYSEALDAKFVDEKGTRHAAIMGCYGIGVTRTVAAVVEEHQDERGIMWPVAVAPYQVHLITVNESDELTRNEAKKLYETLSREGVEVLYDNRNERAGVKFHDADLIGIPLQAILGERNLKNGLVEFKTRQNGKSELVKLDEALSFVRKFVAGQNA